MVAKGTGLIEVLVASLILASGILCLVTLQASALRIGVGSAQRQQASLMLMELAELSRISPETFRQIDPARISMAHGDNVLCTPNRACSPTQFLHYELAGWARLLTQRLPQGDFTIQVVQQHGLIIWAVEIRWHGGQDGAYNSVQAEFVL